MSKLSTAPDAGKTVRLAGRKEWFALSVLCLPLLIVSMDVSVLFFAAPSIAADLHPTATQQLWIFDIYGFVLAGLLLTMGALGDRIGRRRLLLIGTVGFALSSLLAATAQTASVLIMARGIMGIAGSTLMPSTLSLVRAMFQDPAQRTQAMGIWGAVMAGGVSVGPIICGFLLDRFSWGAVFLINIPAMALLMIIAPVLLPEYRSPVRTRIDWIGSLLALAVILPVTYGIKTIAEDGWSLSPVILILTGLIIGVVFVRRQLRIDNPLIDIRALLERRTGGSIVVNFIGMFATMANSVVLTQFLQSVLGYSAFVAALLSVAPAAVVGAAAPMAAKLSTTMGRPRVMTGALLLSAIGFAVLTQVRLDGIFPIALTLVGASLVAAGLVSVMTLVTDYVVGVAPADRAGAVSGLIETSSELGGAFGIALLGSVLAAVYRHTVAPQLPTGLPPEAAALAKETIAGAAVVSQNLPPQPAAEVMTVAKDSFMTAMHMTSLTACFIVLLAAVFTAVMLREKKEALQAAA